MSYNVDEITGYVKENQKELVSKAILKGKTLQYISYQPEIKGSAVLNNLVGDATIQDGSACGFNPAGTTVLSKRTLVTGQFSVQEKLCHKDLLGTYQEWSVRNGLNPGTLPFEQTIVDAKIASVQKQNDTVAWNGDTTITGTTYLNLTDGFIKLIGSDGVNATISGKTLLANPIDAINAMVAAFPSQIDDREDLVIFVGTEVVKKYVMAYNASNLYAGTLMIAQEIVIPNTNIKLVGTAGLSGKNKAYGSYASNFVAGGDILSDLTNTEMLWNPYEHWFQFQMDWNLGFQVRYPEFIVKYLA